MEDLARYLSESDLKQKDFAARLQISGGYLSQILSGEKRPSFELMEKIEVETRGRVSLDCWRTLAVAPAEHEAPQVATDSGRAA